MRRFVYSFACFAFVGMVHLAFFLPAMAAATVHPSSPTIQDGINAAASGDIVLVAPGTYFDNTNFNGKAVTVTSSGGPAVTIIDGSKPLPLAKTSTAKVKANLTGSGK